MTATASARADLIHFDDLEIGKVVDFGRHEVTREEIIAFASAYDPQLIHLDEEVARRSIVGGLCASGFHSCCMLMRMYADDVLNHATSLGAPGIEEAKWMRPVRPGDVLTARYVVKAKRPMASRPDVGIAQLYTEMVNQKGVVVMSWDSHQFMRIRHPEPAAATASAPSPVAKAAKVVSFWDMPKGPPPSRTSNFLEDRVVGEMDDIGGATFTKEDVLAFARAWDPQPFHLDEAAAKASLFGGLAASGWHTVAIYIRQSVAARRVIERAIEAAGGRLAVYGPSPGFKNARWLKPVMVGDTIEFRNRTVAKIDLKSRPDRGLLIFETQGRNQKGEVVFAITGQIFIERREPYRAG